MMRFAFKMFGSRCNGLLDCPRVHTEAVDRGSCRHTTFEYQASPVNLVVEVAPLHHAQPAGTGGAFARDVGRGYNTSQRKTHRRILFLGRIYCAPLHHYFEVQMTKDGNEQATSLAHSILQFQSTLHRKVKNPAHSIIGQGNTCPRGVITAKTPHICPPGPPYFICASSNNAHPTSLYILYGSTSNLGWRFSVAHPRARRIS